MIFVSNLNISDSLLKVLNHEMIDNGLFLLTNAFFNCIEATFFIKQTIE